VRIVSDSRAYLAMAVVDARRKQAGLAPLLEAKTKTIRDVPVSKAHLAQQGALMRLQLFIIGETHRLLSDFTSTARGILLENAGEDGNLDSAEAFMAQQALEESWAKTFMDDWLPLFQAARREAASIPFGTLALYQEKFIKPKAKKLAEQEASPVFEPQLQALIDAANQRIYADGLQLSSRIWRLDRDARDGINRTLMSAVSEGKSAWQTAKDLEVFLGADQGCPRWTSTRLFKLTKKDIASGDRRGLKTGKECQGQGVSYNALRMARTEIQAVHHLASDQIMAAQPWIEQEQINLSPAHPKPDICDDVVAGGDNGDGVYPKGTIVLPLHPHCLCYKTAVMQDEAEFTDRLRAWLGGGPDAGMDGYADFLGVPKEDIPNLSFIDDAISLALGVWLFGGADQLKERVGL
jgi:hypothetical protein